MGALEGQHEAYVLSRSTRPERSEEVPLGCITKYALRRVCTGMPAATVQVGRSRKEALRGTGAEEAGAEAELGAGGLGLYVKAVLGEERRQVDGTIAAQERRAVPGQGRPEPFGRRSGRGQVHEGEAALGAEHASEFGQGRWEGRLRKHVDGVAGEYSVERIVGVGESGGVADADAVPAVGALPESVLGVGQHGRGGVQALRPAGRIGGDERAEGKARAGPYVQYLFPVLDAEPRPAPFAGPAGHQWHQAIVHGGQHSVDASQRGRCAKLASNRHGDTHYDR